MSQNQVFCPSCGAAVTPGAQFCPTCGKPIPAGLRCPKCGSAHSADARFCLACGTPVGEAAATTEGARPTVTPVPSSTPPVVLPAVPLPAPVPGAAAVPSRKGSPTLPFVIGGLALVCICLVCGIGGLAIMIPPKSGGGTSPEAAPGTPPALSDYVPRQTAKGETTLESKEATTTNQPTTIALSDGTQVNLPATTKPVTVKLSRQSNTVQLNAPGLDTSGSMRTLEFDPANADESFVPILTIPAKELGDLDLATVNVARVADIQVNGEILKDQVIYLPVQKDSAGNIVVMDTAASTLPKTTASTGGYAGGKLAMPQAQAGGRTTVEYVPMTFQGHLEWKIDPKLVRMIPDGNAKTGYRHPANSLKDKDVLLKPVVNIVVLVHGHNEEEKGGKPAPTADEPWLRTYKRDVWTELYKAFLDKKEDQLDCTAFYEFIYPTFRSIYSPIVSNPAEPLGDSFVKALTSGSANDYNRLAKMREANMPANLVIVGHSMGGLVARAGIRQFDGWLKENFQQLVTWGTPHHGSPIATLVYVARGPYMAEHYGSTGYGGYKETGSVILFGTSVANWLANRSAALDTPGTRDLRWDNIEPLVLDQKLKVNKDAIPKPKNKEGLPSDEAAYDLTKGSWLYNDNLRKFNESDPYKNTDKYTFMFGVTNKRFEEPSVQLPEPNSEKAIPATVNVQWGETALGATVIIKMLKEPLAPVPGLGVAGHSDGAVPLASMAGLNILANNPSSKGHVDYLGRMDHEEYYSPSSDALYGGMVARRTFDRLGLPQPRCKCPVYEVLSPKPGTTITVGSNLDIEAKLTWPIQVTGSKPGWPATSAEAHIHLGVGGLMQILNLGDLSLSSNGRWSGSFPMPDLGAGARDLVAVSAFPDGSELQSEPVLITLVKPPVTPSLTAKPQAATGAWVLKLVQPDVGKTEVQFSSPGLACSGGTKVTSTETSGTTTTTGTCQVKGALVANETTQHTWSRPPDRLTPGQEFSGSMTASQSGLCGWQGLTTEENCRRYTSTSHSVWQGDGRPGGQKEWSNAHLVFGNDFANIARVSDHPTGSFKWKVPDGSGGNGKTLFLNFNSATSGGTVYTNFWYEWDATGGGQAAATPIVITPAATPTVTQQVTPTSTPTSTPTPTRTPTPATPMLTRGAPTLMSSATPSATEQEFFKVSSLGSANNGANKPTTFSITRSWLVTRIVNYHWNNGRGATPGTIGLRASNGTTYGPWQAVGEPGSGVPNAYWVVKPNIVIPPGTFTVLDSDPSTWSQNQETGGAGMSWGSGDPR